MKKIISCSLFIVFSFYAQAQLYVDGQPLENVFKGKYIKVCPRYIGFNNYRAFIDYGQKLPRKLIGRNYANLSYDRNIKKPIRFYSEIGIMNYVVENGFDVFRLSDSTNCVLYIRAGN
ncbi:MAG TPA: hypothetical protein ENJ95_22495 [Bacteroidetes bacterium]|nr:hypothetical protein [Bacteroidota bacterium]